MGELFGRYFSLLAGRLPGAEYGVIATPTEDSVEPKRDAEPVATDCLCPGE